MNTKKCYFGEKKLFVVVIVVFEYGTSPIGITIGYRCSSLDYL